MYRTTHSLPPTTRRVPAGLLIEVLVSAINIALSFEMCETLAETGKFGMWGMSVEHQPTIQRTGKAIRNSSDTRSTRVDDSIV